MSVPELRVDSVWDADDLIRCQLEPGNQLVDHKAGRRNESVGAEREPPLDRVDIGWLTDR